MPLKILGALLGVFGFLSLPDDENGKSEPPKDPPKSKKSKSQKTKTQKSNEAE